MRTGIAPMVLAMLPWITLGAAEPEAERRPPVRSAPSWPEDAVTAATGKWQLQRVAERIAKPGATGQQDLLWEIIALCEEKPKACEDADLSKIVEYLLFDTGLWRHPNLMETVSNKIPKLLPKTGQRLLDIRVTEWLDRIGMTCSGNEPWTWKDFRRIDPAALAASVHRVTEPSAKHNPLMRFWGAVALFALEDANGVKDFPAAHKKWLEDFPVTGAEAYAQILENLIQHGVRPALLPAIEEVERAADKPQSADGQPARAWYVSRSLMQRIHQILGWPPASENPERRKEDLARIREWLTKHVQDLKWDAEARRFRSELPPPGMEALYEAAQAVEKRWNMKILDPIIQPPYDILIPTRELLSRMKTDATIAGDAAVGDLLAFLQNYRTSRSNQDYEMRNLLLQQVPKLNRKLGIRLWSTALRDALSTAGPKTDLLPQFREADRECVAQSFDALVPEFQKRYNELRGKDDAETALNAAFALILAGGKPVPKAIGELLDKAGAGWNAIRGGNTPASKWLLWFEQTGRPAYLRFLLILAARDLDSYRKNYDHPLRRFQSLCGWTRSGNEATENPADVLASCSAWLDRNEGKLTWEQNRSRFVGALPPDKESAVEPVLPLTAYNLNLDELLEGARTPEEMSERLAIAIARMAKTDEKAAKDPAVKKAIVDLIDRSRLMERGSLPHHLLSAISDFDRPTAVNLLAQAIGISVEETLKKRQLDVRLSSYDRHDNSDLMKEARMQVAERFLKQLDAPEPQPASRRLLTAIVCIYLGGTMESAKFRELAKAYEEKKDEQRLHLIPWATALTTKGSVIGLYLTLLEAKTENDANALSLFARQAGLYRTGRQTIFQHIPRVPAEAAAIYWRWLEENEKEFVREKGRHEFTSPLEKLERVLVPLEDPPAPQPRPHPPAGVPPPRPPEEGKAEQNF